MRPVMYEHAVQYSVPLFLCPLVPLPFCPSVSLSLSIRLCKRDIAVSRSRGGVEGFNRVLPARAARGLNHDRMIRRKEHHAAGIGIVDLAAAQKPKQIVEGRRLRIRAVDLHPIIIEAG